MAKRKDPHPIAGLIKVGAMARARDSNSDTGDMRNVAHEVSYARFHGSEKSLRSLKGTAY